MADIANIHLANNETGGTKKSFNLQETVKDLEFGGEWYDHLSRCFYHSDISRLKGHSYYGGIRSTNRSFTPIQSRLSFLSR